MVDVNTVERFVTNNILHSELFDNADQTKKKKAVNQSKNILMEQLNTAENDLSVQDVSEQAIFLLKIDSTIQRAELGVSQVSVDGISISFRDVDRTLAPSVRNRYGIVDTKKRRVGAYNVSVHDTFRKGQPYPRQHR